MSPDACPCYIYPHFSGCYLHGPKKENNVTKLNMTEAEFETAVLRAYKKHEYPSLAEAAAGVMTIELGLEFKESKIEAVRGELFNHHRTERVAGMLVVSFFGHPYRWNDGRWYSVRSQLHLADDEIDLDDGIIAYVPAGGAA
jgi:hypothetical protein